MKSVKAVLLVLIGIIYSVGVLFAAKPEIHQECQSLIEAIEEGIDQDGKLKDNFYAIKPTILLASYLFWISGRKSRVDVKNVASEFHQYLNEKVIPTFSEEQQKRFSKFDFATKLLLILRINCQINNTTPEEELKQLIEGGFVQVTDSEKLVSQQQIEIRQLKEKNSQLEELLAKYIQEETELKELAQSGYVFNGQNNVAVSVRNLRWEIQSIKYLGSYLKSNNSFQDDRKSQYSEFVKISGLVTNEGIQTTELTDDLMYLLDHQNREIKTAEKYAFYINKGAKDIQYENASPGIPFPFEVIFEIPKDAKIKLIVIKDKDTLEERKILVETDSPNKSKQ